MLDHLGSRTVTCEITPRSRVQGLQEGGGIAVQVPMRHFRISSTQDIFAIHAGKPRVVIPRIAA
jgi:hypothetical protein